MTDKKQQFKNFRESSTSTKVYISFLHFINFIIHLIRCVEKEFQSNLYVVMKDPIARMQQQHSITARPPISPPTTSSFTQPLLASMLNLWDANKICTSALRSTQQCSLASTNAPPTTLPTISTTRSSSLSTNLRCYHNPSSPTKWVANIHVGPSQLNLPENCRGYWNCTCL